MDNHYPTATKVRLVMGPFNTHILSSLYEAFDPETARRLVKRLKIPDTSIHGSWLNLADIEMSVRPCKVWIEKYHRLTTLV